MLMSVNDALKQMGGTQLGYIRMICYEQAGGPAMERTLDTYMIDELLNALTLDCLAYYTIGSYYYIVYKK